MLLKSDRVAFCRTQVTQYFRHLYLKDASCYKSKAVLQKSCQPLGFEHHCSAFSTFQLLHGYQGWGKIDFVPKSIYLFLNRSPPMIT